MIASQTCSSTQFLIQDGHVCGVLDPAIARELEVHFADDGFCRVHTHALTLPPLTDALCIRLSQHFRAQNYRLRPVTDEKLNIVRLTDDTTRLTVAPKYLCRLLGLATQVVRLIVSIEYQQQTYFYLQQRAHTKEVSPGLWDTFVAGTLQAGETPWQGMQREAYEEAAFTLPALTPLPAFYRARYFEGEGFVLEKTFLFHWQLTSPERLHHFHAQYLGRAPHSARLAHPLFNCAHNHDGEVQAFQWVSQTQLAQTPMMPEALMAIHHLQV